jgi:ElaB/YqjD/DUF883 family membrane-anchored ribosome-binding protein
MLKCNLIQKIQLLNTMHSRTKTHNGGALETDAENALETLKEKAAHMQERIKTGVASTETTIREHPWTSIGVAAGVGVSLGLVLGLLMRRD